MWSVISGGTVQAVADSPAEAFFGRQFAVDGLDGFPVAVAEEAEEFPCVFLMRGAELGKSNADGRCSEPYPCRGGGNCCR